MRTLTFLLSFLFAVLQADAYTIVLKNGRELTGVVLGEDNQTLQVRDLATGVRLSIKKEQIDTAGTQRANAPQADPQVAVVTPPAVPPAPERIRPAELARLLRSTRSGKVRVYTLADLERAPQISLLSSAKAEASVGSTKSPTPDRSEAEWRREAAAVRKEVETAVDKVSAAERDCNQEREEQQQALLSPHKAAQDMGRLMSEPPVCKRLQQLQERLANARARADAFEERARKAAVPWSWIE